VKLTVDVIGWFAAGAVLVAYALVSTGRVKAASYSYQGLNFFGGVGLAANTFYYMSYPSTALNIVWALVAVYAIWKLLGARGQAAG
jgi:hypothetical protein